MEKIYNYQRISKSNRTPGNILDIGNAGSFMKIAELKCAPTDEYVIDGTVFKSIYKIESWTDNRMFTAYRSAEEQSILLIIWEKYPFYNQIEEGGDFMLQVLATDKNVRHLIIDNTLVRSGWMNEKMIDYLNNGWFPGLVELELEAFCHLQAESYLGGISFSSFGELVSNNINSIAQILGKKPFKYYPIKTSDMNLYGKIDENVRNIALNKALEIIRSL